MKHTLYDSRGNHLGVSADSLVEAFTKAKEFTGDVQIRDAQGSIVAIKKAGTGKTGRCGCGGKRDEARDS